MDENWGERPPASGAQAPATQRAKSAAGRRPSSMAAKPSAIALANLKPWPEQHESAQPALPRERATNRSCGSTV